MRLKVNFFCVFINRISIYFFHLEYIGIIKLFYYSSCVKNVNQFVFNVFSHAGLHSRIISGYAKGVNYKTGMKFNPGKNQHNWNAVYINGTWGLVDADWAAREIIKKLWKLRYRLDEHFFLPDPHHFICDHFPDEDQ